MAQPLSAKCLEESVVVEVREKRCQAARQPVNLVLSTAANPEMWRTAVPTAKNSSSQERLVAWRDCHY
jgi:hypothetical protein